MRRVLSSLSLYALSICLFQATSVSAQFTTAQEKGLPPNSVFHIGEVDVVNLQNGNLHISIPIAAEKQRGGETITWQLVYDSPTWTKHWTADPCPGQVPSDMSVRVYDDPAHNPNPVLPCQPTGKYLAQSGNQLSSNWRFTTPFDWDYGFDEHHETCPIGFHIGIHPQEAYTEYPDVDLQTNWHVTDPQGTSHPVPLRSDLMYIDTYIGPTYCLGKVTKGPALDGSGMYLDLGQTDDQGRNSQSQTIFKKNGDQVIWTSDIKLRDTNGNLITGAGDTASRTIITTSYSPNYNPSSPPPGSYFVIYSVKDSNGDARDYRVDYSTVHLISNVCPQFVDSVQPQECYEVESDTPEISGITLPNGKTYIFHYNANTPGELRELDLPTGATIEYTYTDFYNWIPNSYSKSLQPDVAGGRAVQTRKVTVDGHSYTWSYNYVNGSLTDPDGNVEQRTYGPIAGTSTGTSNGIYYQSTSLYEVASSLADSNGHVYKTTQTQYDSNFNPLDNTASGVRPIRVTTTLDNGLVSKTETDYETISTTCCPAGRMRTSSRRAPVPKKFASTHLDKVSLAHCFGAPCTPIFTSRLQPIQILISLIAL